MARHIRRAHPGEYAKISDSISERESDLDLVTLQSNTFEVANYYDTIEQDHVEATNDDGEIISMEMESQINALCKICKETLTCPQNDTRKLEWHWREKHRVMLVEFFHTTIEKGYREILSHFCII